MNTQAFMENKISYLVRVNVYAKHFYSVLCHSYDVHKMSTSIIGVDTILIAHT